MATQKDPSNGYEAIASEFMKHRSKSIGVATVRKWAHTVTPGAAMLDLGCGHGDPLAVALIDDGYEIYGIDASPRLVSAFHRRLPQAHVTCEAVEVSSFFARAFEGVLAVGLVFLLDAGTQKELILKVAQTLAPGGRFLFTAPRQVCTWTDILTGRPSQSLGAERYEAILTGAGLTLVDEHVDRGQTHYLPLASKNNETTTTGTTAVRWLSWSVSNVRYKGRIVEWRDDRGFGFISPALGGDRVFVHIRSFVNRSRRPVGKELVTYEIKRDTKGRLQGVNVAFSGDKALEPSTSKRGTGPLMLATLFIALIAGAVASGWLPPYMVGLYLIASVIAFLAYAWDKWAARNNRRRTAESTLHLFGLLGGWPGAIVAQQMLRHKSKKQSFRRVFWGTVVLNCGALLWFLSRAEGLVW